MYSSMYAYCRIAKANMPVTTIDVTEMHLCYSQHKHMYACHHLATILCTVSLCHSVLFLSVTITAIMTVTTL